MTIRRTGSLLLLAVTVLLTGCKPEILDPMPRALFERAQGPVEVTFDLRHDEGATLVFQFKRNGSFVPAPSVNDAEFETPKALSTLQQGPRRTQATFAFDQPGTWWVRASDNRPERVWTAWQPFLVVDQDNSLVAAQLVLRPTTVEGPCPAEIDAEGLIGSAAAGRVRYWFRDADGKQTPPITGNVATPGALVAKTILTVAGGPDQRSTSGWLELVVEPMSLPGPQVSSGQVAFEVSCTEISGSNQ